LNVHFIDSGLYRDQFGTAEMRSLFTDTRMVQTWLDVEAALARSEGRLGLIPQAAARAITESARVELINLEEMKRQIDVTRHPLMPLITQFAESCPDGSGEYVHWGATTQDIMDTATVLQLREAIGILERQVGELTDVLADLARQYRATAMAGRTHGQHALPITFGFKLAVIIAELERHRERLAELRPRILVGQLSGAVGTLAALGERGSDVQREFMRELGLATPAIAWHSSRDSFAEFVCVAAMIGATCAKAAGEVISLQKTEVAELEEPNSAQSVGSSTMPQKRNPMVCEAIVAIGRILRQQTALAIDCMVQQHERDMSAWQAEWEFIPETSILLGGALEQTRGVFAGLAVRPDRMAHNLHLTEGLINAEAVMIALAASIGRQRAHAVVGRAARESFEVRRPFVECLMDDADVRRHMSRDELERLLTPETYLGDSISAVDDLLATLKMRREPSQRSQY
jgi:3-carboxy-cis,cis-muconate cycloisomerase